VLSDQSLKNNNYLSDLKVRGVLSFSKKDRVDFPVFSEFKQGSAHDYDVILHRKDPPIDEFYIEHHKKYLELPESVIQVNHPKVTLKYAEHELPQMFPEFSIPTTTLNSFDEIYSHAKDLSFNVVLKPHNSCSGLGIIFIFSEAELLKNKAHLENGFPWVGQPFVPNIEKLGDLRVLYFNGVHMGQVLRLPAKGSLLANIHQGGSVAKADLTPVQERASEVVAEKLLSMGAYFIGIDFLGDQISEVNITSPMGLRQLNSLYGVQSHFQFVDILEGIVA
jgi:glutathione synthase